MGNKKRTLAIVLSVFLGHCVVCLPWSLYCLSSLAIVLSFFYLRVLITPLVSLLLNIWSFFVSPILSLQPIKINFIKQWSTIPATSTVRMTTSHLKRWTHTNNKKLRCISKSWLETCTTCFLIKLVDGISPHPSDHQWQSRYVGFNAL